MTNSYDIPRDDPPDVKGMLFCPDCEHRSALGGDWEVRTDSDADAYEYRCPDCGASVLSQPVFGADSEADLRSAAA